MIYQLIVLIVAAAALIIGFRKGLARQTPAVIGVAFGIISGRLLAPGLNDVLYGAFPSVHGKVEQTFVYDTIASTLVFTGICLVFRVVTSFLGDVMKRDDRTILDNIAGAVYALFEYMLITSIVLNMGVALNRNSSLLRHVKSDDGNAIEEVMLLAPALLGGEDVVDLSHRIQLEEAKKIS